MVIITKPFEDLNGKFKARLKASQIKERSFMAREGTITLTSVIGLFEANFNIDTLTHLEKPNFIAAKRTDKKGETYLIYEVTAVKPIHYQMLAMSQGMPKIVRHEYLEKVDQSWEKAEDTWIDIYSVYTGYTMKKQEKGDYKFERNETIVPLEGAESKLLSVEMVERFINVKDGTSVGTMEGFNKDLLINLEKLVKYHGAVFGFTGVGKSNLTAILTRKILEKLPDTKIAVIDVAGEYGVGLADQVTKQGAIYTTENYQAAEDKIDAFLASQATPETLYDALKKTQSTNALEEYAEAIFKTGKIRYLNLEEPTFELILEELEASDRAEAKSLAMDLRNTLEEANISPTSPIGEVLANKEVHDNICKAIIDCEQTVKGLRYPPEKLLSQLAYIMKWIEASTKEKQEEEKERINPEKVARKLADTKDPERLLITYIPDPTEARHFTIRLINEVLALRKRKSKGPRILVVIDEAQEFIPDRAVRDDLTLQSNLAVERLLRQGRKYMVHGWVSTQRVAHLNVNAVQQIQSFFVGTLPREYDRRVIAEATGISPDILDKTAYLDMGEWMFVSFRATELRNIPVFIKAQNNEDLLLRWFST